MKHRILVLDDKPSGAAATSAALRDAGFPVLAVSDVPQALVALDAGGITVVVAEQRLAGTTGAGFLERCAHEHPDVMRLLIFGARDEREARSAIESGIVFQLIWTPWTAEGIVAAVASAARFFDLAEQERNEFDAEEKTPTVSLESELAETVEIPVSRFPVVSR